MEIKIDTVNENFRRESAVGTKHSAKVLPYMDGPVFFAASRGELVLVGDIVAQ